MWARRGGPAAVQEIYGDYREVLVRGDRLLERNELIDARVHRAVGPFVPVELEAERLKVVLVFVRDHAHEDEVTRPPGRPLDELTKRGWPTMLRTRWTHCFRAWPTLHSPATWDLET